MTMYEQGEKFITPELVSTKTGGVSGAHGDKKKEGRKGITSYTLSLLSCIGLVFTLGIVESGIAILSWGFGLILGLLGLVLSIIGVIKGKRGLTLTAMIIAIIIILLFGVLKLVIKNT